MATAKSIYFIGIGGIGMSALARFLKFQKWDVAGSDLTASPLTEALIKEGISVKIGHKRGSIGPNTGVVVYNRAIADGPGNVELTAARRSGIPTVPYAEILGAVTKAYTTVAVTGSHGKSTTTALAALALIKGGFDPTVLIGTNLREFAGKNMRMGKQAAGKPGWLVLEADDFGGAFLHYSPAIAIVTNIDREHLDFYKTFKNVKKAFLGFLSQTLEGGVWILNRDDKNLYSLHAKISLLAKEKHVRVVWYSLKSTAARKIKKAMQIAGEHNRSNAAAVYALGKVLKISEKKILSALGLYTGAWRRMEYRGQFLDAKVFDDYAHHPTEVKATLAAFREWFPRSPLICVFQPHQAQRLSALFNDFAGAFDSADIVIILPLYKVRGRDVEIMKNRDSAALVRTMHKKFPAKAMFYLDNPKLLKDLIKKIHLPSPVLVMMGAGDIAKYTEDLIRVRSHMPA